MTRRAVETARRWEYRDRRRGADDVWLVDDALTTKRRLKARVRRWRARSVPFGIPDRLRVDTEPAVAHAHHPLTESDVLRLLAAFPCDVRSMLTAVHRRVGLAEGDMIDDDVAPDPLTSRMGYEMPGGIWSPRLLGRAHHEPLSIDLFAYVYDERALRVPEVQSVILWLRQARTLAHEAAHIWDMARSSRDRWALDEVGRAERYAEARAHEWVETAAAQVFADAHPQRAAAFDEWVRRHVGIPISPARVAWDLERAWWGVDKGLLEICGGDWDVESMDARVEVAREFHYVDDFEPARHILETVVEAEPDHIGATVLMGDIAVHEEDAPRALEWTARAVHLAPTLTDAWDDRVGALIGARQWAAATAACDELLRLDPTDDRPRLKRARCLMELGDFAAADETLDAVVAGGRRPRDASAATALRAESLIRRDRWQDALTLATAALARGAPHWHRAFLRAAAWEAAHRLDLAEPAHPPTARDIEFLESSDRDEWAHRLIALGLHPEPLRVTRRGAALRRRDVGVLTKL